MVQMMLEHICIIECLLPIMIILKIISLQLVLIGMWNYFVMEMLNWMIKEIISLSQNLNQTPGSSDGSMTKTTNFDLLKTQHKDLQQQFRQLTKDYNKLDKEFKALHAIHTENVDKYTKLEEKLTEKEEYIEKLEESGVTPKAKKIANMKTDVVSCIEEATKFIMSRKYKFIRNEGMLREATAEIIPYLKCKITEPVENFVETYMDVFNKGVCEARGYVQNEGKKKAEGMSDLRMICCSAFP